MKNFQLVVVALVAILGFNSCSNQFESNNEKKLVKYVCVDDTNFKLLEQSIEYNEKGQAISIQDDHYFADDEYSLGLHQFNWNENSIDATQELSVKLFGEYLDQTINCTITLENNRFTKFEYDVKNAISNYTYDKEGRMQTYIDAISDATCVWDADKLISINNAYYNTEHKFTYTYENISCVKGYCPIIIKNIQTEPLPFAHPEFVGLRTKQCPISVEYTYFEGDEPVGTDHYSYEYEFDNEGYITKIIETIKIQNEDILHIQTYTLTWE